jgi:hypothetical protein
VLNLTQTIIIDLPAQGTAASNRAGITPDRVIDRAAPLKSAKADCVPL